MRSNVPLGRMMTTRNDRFQSRTLATQARVAGEWGTPPAPVVDTTDDAAAGVDGASSSQALLARCPHTLVVLDRDATIRYVVSGGEQALGYRSRELISHAALELIHSEDVRTASDWFERVIETPGRVSLVVCQVRHKRGSWHRVESLVKNCLNDPAVEGVLVSARRVAPRAHRAERIRRYRRALRDLTRELALTEERQRQRLATDLHDHLGQCLALARMKMDALRSAEVPQDVSESLDAVAQLVDQAVRVTRSMTVDLSPPILTESALPAILQWLAERMQEDYGLTVLIDADGNDQVLAEERRVFIFRAVRELLINVVKHAGVREAQVTLRRDDTHVSITVADAGVGFDTAMAPTRPARTGGFGLFSLRQRLAYFGGRLDIGSEPNGGTKVILSVPSSGVDDDH